MLRVHCAALEQQTPDACLSIPQSYGGHSEGETPGPIPNPEAKPFSADGTAPATVWESRTPPDIHPRKGDLFVRSPFLRSGAFPRGKWSRSCAAIGRIGATTSMCRSREWRPFDPVGFRRLVDDCDAVPRPAAAAELGRATRDGPYPRRPSRRGGRDQAWNTRGDPRKEAGSSAKSARLASAAPPPRRSRYLRARSPLRWPAPWNGQSFVLAGAVGPLRESDGRLGIPDAEDPLRFAAELRSPPCRSSTRW